MASNRVWLVGHIPGNPEVIQGKTYINGPYTRKEALENASRIDGRWRVWVTHVKSRKRIFASAGLIAFEAAYPDVILY